MPKSKIRSLMNFLRFYVRFESQEMMDKFEKGVAQITQDTTTMGIEEFLLDRAEKEGIKKGIEKEKRDIIVNLLKKPDFNNEQIAEIMGVSTLMVEQVKNEIAKQ